LAAHRGADVELGDRVTVATLCFGFAIWFRDEKSQLQSQQTNRERQYARLPWALTSQPSHILIQLRTKCIPRVGPHRIGGHGGRPACLPSGPAVCIFVLDSKFRFFLGKTRLQQVLFPVIQNKKPYIPYFSLSRNSMSCPLAIPLSFLNFCLALPSPYEFCCRYLEIACFQIYERQNS
jgi:hypothetical protein